jgi:hypothetical protein
MIKYEVPNNMFMKMRFAHTNWETIVLFLDNIPKEFNGEWLDDEHFEIAFKSEHDLTLFLLKWS